MQVQEEIRQHHHNAIAAVDRHRDAGRRFSKAANCESYRPGPCEFSVGLIGKSKVAMGVVERSYADSPDHIA